MQSHSKKIKDIIQIAVIIILCIVAIVLDFVYIEYLKNPLRNRLLAKCIQQTCGGIAAILIMYRLNIRLFSRPQNCLYFLPCLVIAMDNFQFFAFFSGKMRLVHTHPLDFILFAAYCLAVGLFEECIFRGIIFSLLASCFPKNKKGFLLTYVVSSLIFGFAHIFNGFSLNTLLQIGYTILTGGLFAFCLIKTKNILCCAFIHAVYNFCGLLFGTEDALGLGTGVVFDTGTVITMLVVSIIVGIFILYKVFTYSDKERLTLYKKLNVKSV